jgi:hypothetical protein
MWTESWTNWDPQSTNYPAPTINKSGTITANETWTAGNTYLLQGLVYIDSLVTLTIEPGVIIRGDNNTANSSLIVRRGAKLMAEGTPCAPIVFTSSKAAGSRAVGDWGGVIMLGRAINNQGQNVLIEGLSAANSANYHGGTDNSDNSGVLKYVRIEYGGFVFSSNNEINGLTMGSVGSGTTIDYVQVSFTNDDAFEWFGGSVSARHLVAYRNLDDDFDTDFGWSGTVQYALAVRDPNIADNPAVSTSEGFESDNDPAGTNQAIQPKTNGSFYNVTHIGPFRCASNTAGTGVQPGVTGFQRALRLRRNTDLKVFNSIFMNHWRGVHFDGALAQANVDQDSLRFRNNIIAGDFSSTWTAPYNSPNKSVAAFDAASRTRLFNTAYQNDSLNTCALLVNAWSFTNADYRPNVAGDGAIATDPTNLNAGTDLTPFGDIESNLFSASQSRDFIMYIAENGGGASSGVIELTIAKPSGWDITVPGITLSGTDQSGVNGTSNIFGPQPNNNGDWVFRQDANNVYATSKPGVVIPKSGSIAVGFTAVRKAGTSAGTNQNLSASVSGGGDNSASNNGTTVGLSAN